MISYKAIAVVGLPFNVQGLESDFQFLIDRPNVPCKGCTFPEVLAFSFLLAEKKEYCGCTSVITQTFYLG